MAQMPLDKEHGEVLDGFAGSAHIVIPHRHLAEMTNLLVTYMKPGTGKFKRPKEAVRPLFDDAMATAAQRFSEAGALLPLTHDDSSILCQVYPNDDKVAIVVARQIAGEDHFVVRSYELPQPVIEALLVNAGKRMIREH